MNELLLSFYGDDFTGSTDAMEALSLAGVRTVLFTRPPTREELAKYRDLRAFGVAGTTRSMPPDEMDGTLRPAFASIRELNVPIVHYKICSTFDSSPQVGSIGRAINVGADVFASKFVPLVVGAPSLGRYCAFGNLFARFGDDGDLFRLDRHPSMSRHPVTPMDEADLLRHLSKQTTKRVGLFDLLSLERPDVMAQFDEFRSTDVEVGLIDLVYDRQLAMVGPLIDRCHRPTFVVGSSGVQSSLCAHWRERGTIRGTAAFAPVAPADPIVAVCGSCSPVTAEQIQWATADGFSEVCELDSAVAQSIDALCHKRSVVIHSQRIESTHADKIGCSLGQILREVLAAAKVKRVVVAGGDTSGEIARELGIDSMEMIGTLTRGAPLCRVTAPGSPADGIQMIFKGGQIGPADFFGMVEKGTANG